MAFSLATLVVIKRIFKEWEKHALEWCAQWSECRCRSLPYDGEGRIKQQKPKSIYVLIERNSNMHIPKLALKNVTIIWAYN